MATDYTAFESLFTKEVMESCEFVMYEYMTQYLPCHKIFMHYIRKVIAGTNHCVFKYFTIDVLATRMSGEMNTSLGNGFSNLMFTLFLAEENGCLNIRGVVEGDDGLFTMEGLFPTVEQYKSLGLVIKQDIHDSISTASFCGIVFADRDRNIITNPLDEILNFGYCSGKYAKANERTRMQLLRAKALSMVYQYPGCPMLGALARYGLRMTKNCQVGRLLNNGTFNMWEKEQLLEALAYFKKDYKHLSIQKDIGFDSRLLVEQLYGIPITVQVKFEEYMDAKTDLSPINFPLLDHFVHPDQIDYYWRYQRVAGTPETPVLVAEPKCHKFKFEVGLKRGPLMIMPLP